MKNKPGAVHAPGLVFSGILAEISKEIKMKN